MSHYLYIVSKEPNEAERAFGAHLRTLRDRRNLNQQDVADGLRTSRQTIINWEKGKGAPKIAQLPLLAQILDVELAQLVGGGLPDEPEADSLAVARRFVSEFAPTWEAIRHVVANAHIEEE